MLPSADDLVRLIERHPGEKTRPLAARLDVADEHFDDLVSLLLSAQRSGRIVRVPHGGWHIPERTDFRVGCLRLSRGGKGFVRVAPGTIREEDLFLRERDRGSALSGDLVLVQLASGRGGRGRQGELLREARVVDVLERGRQLIRGRYFTTRGGGVVRISGAQPAAGVFVPQAEAGRARDGEEVLVRVSQEGSRGPQLRGRVVIRRAEEGTLEGDLLVLRECFGLPDRYPQAAVNEAEALEAIAPRKVWPDRVDLRGERTITIDPVDSKDFDDAISLDRLPGGTLRLGVHIADVSHFVRPGSALDGEAEKRGTSVYLPGHTIHMLPRRLSEDLASLRPGEDRLTKTVRMTISPAGHVEKVEVFRSVIRNTRRFTYEEVLAILEWIDSGAPAGKDSGLPPDAAQLADVLGEMARLRDRLHERRRKRGALDLDIPKLRLAVDSRGEVTGVGRDARDPSHSLIEEFMLAGNEAVARYCVENNLPLVARIHAPPEHKKLEEFRAFLAAIGLKMGTKADAQELQHLVDRIAGDPLSGVVQLALLRSMEHAEYVVGPGLHFALATDCYCHFTSPIRRYPDLVVHQLLDEHFDGGMKDPARRRRWAERLPHIAEKSSELERRAEEAEREMTRLRLIRYLVPRIGETMSGRIVSVHPFGFFVRVDGTLIEGMVPVSLLEDDYYDFDKPRLLLCGRGTRRRFAIGERIRVELHNVDPDLREITFRVVEAEGRAHGGEARGEGSRARCAPKARRASKAAARKRTVATPRRDARIRRGSRSARRRR